MLESRQQPHRPLKARTIAVPDSSAAKIPGLTIDLSPVGAGVLLERQLSPHTQCTLYVQLPVGGDTAYLTVHVEVIYAVLEGGTSQFRTGVRFIQLTPDAQLLLTKVLTR